MSSQRYPFAPSRLVKFRHLTDIYSLFEVALIVSTPVSAAVYPSPQTKAALTVCIDPGHPSEVNAGKTIQNGTTETHIDWLVAIQLKKILTRAGIHVVMTKSSEDELVRNRTRAEIANRANADLAIRLHCDASPDTGYAIYYPDRQGTAQGTTGPSSEVISSSKLAAIDIDSVMRQMLNGVLKDGGVRGDSKTLIGSKQGALTGSIFSTIPVVTIEMVVLSNRHDAAFISTAQGQQTMANAIAAGILKHFRSASSTSQSSPQSSN